MRNRLPQQNAQGLAMLASLKGAKSAKPWNPENDDGDSARLRTDLNIDIEWMDRSVDVTASCVLPWVSCFVRDTDHNNDKHAALRYATLMVAAEIGRRMP